jgi:conjugative relaxase-like TrwC/TraI family protein
MLSIGKLGVGQERYYTEKVAEGAEDYYAGEGEAEGYWLGNAAEDLGFQGKIEGDQLTAVLTGVDPASGEPFGMRQVAGRGPVPGFDLTFSAPKSVSLTWALGGHPASIEVAAAHRASVEAALDYMQRVACWTRRGAEIEFVPGNGFLAAAYLHRSSRAGDPQLHTHVLIANATQGPDGRWTRLYHPAIYDHAKTAGYIYEANLRHELTERLGVRWLEVKNGIAEIEGFDPADLRAFSTRRQEILEATGPDASARARQIATLETRKAKEPDLTSESLRERWRDKAAELGLDREEIARTMGHERQAPEGVVSIAVVEAAVTAHASHFDRRDVIQAVADNLPAGLRAAEVEELADNFLSLDSVVAIAESAKGQRFTTARIWELERRALAEAEGMANVSDRAVAGDLIAARVIARRPSLKPDQRAMVDELLTGGEGLAIVVGEAGSGKTYATLAVAEGWSAGGTEVRVAAPTWRAANVLRSEGLEAESIARLLGELDHRAAAGRSGLARGSALMIDEAGMVDSATLARLIDHAQAAEAKLVLIGDPAQLGEIEAGGLFASLVDRSDPIVLDEVIRHSHELDREGAKRIREGHGSEALSLYRSEERVTIAETPEERREAMVADWWQSYEAGEDALMVAKRNVEVEKLNVLAREVMRAEGRLSENEIEVGEQLFAAGDQVITRVNDNQAEIYNRERWQVAEVDAAQQTVTLDGIDTQRRVCVDSLYLERVNPNDEAAALQYAYAATTYQAQGATVDTAFVMADPSMDRQEFYVAASRSRGETMFYATPEVQLDRDEIAPASAFLRDGLEHIAEAAERNGAQVSAHDEALRSELAPLSTEELVARGAGIRAEAGAEAANQRTYDALDERIARAGEHQAEVQARREGLGEPPSGWRHRDERREHEFQARQLGTRELRSREAAARLEAKQQALPAIEHGARAQVAVIDDLLAERERVALAAARVSAPGYITRELGERPIEPAGQHAWDRGVREIEGYRQRNGIGDRDTALGLEPKDRAAQLQREAAERSIQRAQRNLGLEQARTIERTRSLSMGIE